MPAIAVKKENISEIAVVKRMKDYSKETVFKKKAGKAIAFLKKNGLPKAVARKKK